METVRVDLGDRSYDIVIGPSLIHQSSFYSNAIAGSQVCIVSNETVAPLYLNSVVEALSDAYQVDTVILPDGEQYKDLTHLNLIFDCLLEKRHNRKTTLIALGGGVVGDMTGFAAATYQRGVNFIQVPTTLLSQVDSSVGGKTGVNHSLGKNMIGAFHQPQLVIIDTNVLSTLPDREMSAGLAEVIKYGLIWDAEFYDWLEKHMADLLHKEGEALQHAIKTSCEIKAKVVAEDEREGGIRAILNLGHTFGHAVESALGYGQWLHGEAVGLGMLLAADLSCREGYIDSQVVGQLEALLREAQLPVDIPPDMTPERFLQFMAVDKKVISNKLRLVLMEKLGKAIVTENFDHRHLMATLERQ